MRKFKTGRGGINNSETWRKGEFLMKLHRSKLFITAAAVCLFAACLSHADDKRHTLWKVKGKKNPVYLLGSLHLLKQKDYPLGSAIEDAFRKSDVVVFEVDMNRINDAEVQQITLRKAILPGGQTLESKLSAKTYDLLKKECLENGLNAAVLSKVKPWFAAVTLSMRKLMQLGFSPDYGVDRHYFRKARKAGKKTSNLETIEYQIGLFDSFSYDEQDKLLAQTVVEMNTIEKDMDDIVAAWKTGDIKTLEKKLLKSFKEYPVIHRKFLTNRNKKWIGKIEEFLKTPESVMIIVGTGHLVGKESVISLLKKKGYDVKQM